MSVSCFKKGGTYYLSKFAGNLKSLLLTCHDRCVLIFFRTLLPNWGPESPVIKKNTVESAWIQEVAHLLPESEPVPPPKKRKHCRECPLSTKCLDLGEVAQLLFESEPVPLHKMGNHCRKWPRLTKCLDLGEVAHLFL